MERSGNKLLRFFLVAIAVFVFWNYWIVTAKHFFSRQDASYSLDFRDYYAAGLSYLQHTNPYLDRDNRPSGYIYPPAMLPVYGWFARFEPERARVAWTLAYFLLFALAYAALLFQYRRRGLPDILAVSALLLALCYTVLTHILIGQIDVLVSSLAFLGFVAYSRGWRAPSALLLALCTLIKVNPAVLLIFYVVYNRDYRYLAYYALGLAALVALSLRWVPGELYPYYAGSVLPRLTGGNAYFWNQSLIRLCCGFGTLLPRLVSAAGIVGFAALAWRNGGARKEGCDREVWYLMNVLVLLLFSGYAWTMAYVWVLLPSILPYAEALRKASGKYVALFTLSLFLAMSKLYELPVLDSLNMIGAVLLFFVLLRFKKEYAGGELRELAPASAP